MIEIIKDKNYNYNEMMTAIRQLMSIYPFIEKKVIGKSVMGKDIVALSVGSGREVLMAAAFHGNEGITSPIVLKFLAELGNGLLKRNLISGVSVAQALSKNRVTIIPRVNPDGCDISTEGEKACGASGPYLKKLCGGDFKTFSANARGVDINHNFDAAWNELRKLERQNGIYGPAPKRYGGPKPESEPETASLTAYCRSHPIAKVMALHTQGEVIYWDFKQLYGEAA